MPLHFKGLMHCTMLSYDFLYFTLHCVCLLPLGAGGIMFLGCPCVHLCAYIWKVYEHDIF